MRIITIDHQVIKCTPVLTDKYAPLGIFHQNGSSAALEPVQLQAS